MSLIFRYLSPYKLRLSIGLTVKFVGSVMDLFLPMILAHLLDVVVPGKRMAEIFYWGGVMILCSVAALLGNIIANRMAARVARDTTRELRRDLFEKTMRLPARRIDAITVPSLESRLTSDTYNIHQFIGMIQRMGVRAPILLLGGVILTMAMEPVLTTVLLAVLPLIAIVVYIVTGRGIPMFTSLQETVDKMVRVVRENVGGIRIIKALSKTDYEIARFRGVNEEIRAKDIKSGVLMAATNPIMNLLLNGGLTAVILVGAFRVNAGHSEAGKIIAFLTYFTIILNAMMSITRIFVMSSRAIASAGRIGKVLSEPFEFEGETFPAIPAAPAGDVPHVRFNGVSFSYNGARDNLKNISFEIRRGGSLGIIGATGSGKTTIIKLLMRLYDADFGEIQINGEDIRNIKPDLLRKKFGAAQQNDFLFADTIYENIDFSRGLDEEKIKSAAETAQALQFISEKEDDFRHELLIRGSNLSGGQKQRMYIARAIAGDPEILVLDDSSSALDYKTDALLRKAIAEKMDGITAVIISQRISSVMNCDCILMLDDGEVIARGSHGELLESCPEYRQINDSQLGGALIE